MATATNSTSGTDAVLHANNLPAEGTYHIHVLAGAGHSGNTGNYMLTLWDASVRAAVLDVNEPITGWPRLTIRISGLSAQLRKSKCS